MKRGHAEALMPLIARVMKEAGTGSQRSTASRSTIGPGSFTGLRVGLSAARGIALAAGKPVGRRHHADRLRRACRHRERRAPIIAAIDARHDHVYLQVVSGNGGSLVTPRVAPIDEALRAARSARRDLVGNAGAASSLSAGQRTRRRRSRSSRSRARYRLGGVARRRGRSCSGAAASALSARARCQAAGPLPRAADSPPHDRLVVATGRERRHRRCRAATLARCGAARAIACARHFIAAGAKANSRPLPSDRNTLVHRLKLGRKVIGFAVSRMAADEAEILVDRGRRRAIAAAAFRAASCSTHLGHLAGRGIRDHILEVEEITQPARRLYRTHRIRRRRPPRAVLQAAGGEQSNALLMRRDLS